MSCHNVNFDFSTILDAVLAEAVPRSAHPVILKLSPDYDYLATPAGGPGRGVRADRDQHREGAAAGPAHRQPWLANRYGGLSGRAIKPIGLRVVAELRDAGVTLPIIATGGVRTVDDCREYFWAGADAVSLGSATWLASYPGYAARSAAGLRVRRVLSTVRRYRTLPARYPPSALSEDLHPDAEGAVGRHVTR